MEVRIGCPFEGKFLEQLCAFLASNGLTYDERVTYSLCLVEDERIAAAGSLDGNVLKCIAVSKDFQEAGLAAQIISGLVSEAARNGIFHLFIFTKPQNESLFASLGFYAIAKTGDVLLMENKKNGVHDFVSALSDTTKKLMAGISEGKTGAIVMNCNPFTRGHQYLIETAAQQCACLHVFVVSENKSAFPAGARYALVKAGTAHVANALVHPTGPYLISSATFPDYFFKDSVSPAAVNTELDLVIFAERFALPLGITRRFVGTEPFDQVTAAYNSQMKRVLPRYGIEVVEIERLAQNAKPVSASSVRELLAAGKMEEIRELVPPATFEFLLAWMEGTMTTDPHDCEGFFTDAKKVVLQEVLAFREEKARRQHTLLATHAAPLLCLGLNMPGEYKRFALADRSFEEERRIVRQSLDAERIAVLHEETLEAAGGYAAFIATDAPPEQLKNAAERIETTHPLGRLFDIDVLKQDGGKISRADRGAPPRRCLICGDDAFACGRSRAHSAEELQHAAVRIMARFQRSRVQDLVAAAALRALVGEAAITPKPGLVDRANNGAHRDMNFFSFIDSTAAIIPYFRFCARAGFDAAAEKPEVLMRRSEDLTDTPLALFNRLRPEGKIAELHMLAASGGANTHRGLIFSAGIAGAAFGALFRHGEHAAPDAVLDFAACMTRGIAGDFDGMDGRADISHGGAVYQRYGIGGVREEARRGFPAVREALPILRQALHAGLPLNDAGITVFFHLLSAVADTNIIHRSSPAALAAIQRDAAAFLVAHPNPATMAERATQLDREFIAQNISPGGSADLLALTLFLHYLCN